MSFTGSRRRRPRSSWAALALTFAAVPGAGALDGSASSSASVSVSGSGSGSSASGSGDSNILARCETLARAAAVDATLAAPAGDAVPTEVLEALSAYSDGSLAMDWAALPDIIKVALLWQHGYVYTGLAAGGSSDSPTGDALVEVYTPCEADGADGGAAMDAIAVPSDAFGCSVNDCGNFEQSVNDECDADVADLFQCAIVAGDASIPSSTSSAWSSAISTSAIPYPQAYLHAVYIGESSSSSSSSGAAEEVFAIHMRATDSGTDCYNMGDTIIPCRVLHKSASSSSSSDTAAASSFCRPSVNASQVAAFLSVSMSTAEVGSSTSDDGSTLTQATGTDSGSSSHFALVIGICVGFFLVVALAFCIWRCRRRRSGSDTGNQLETRAIGSRQEGRQQRGSSWRNSLFGSVIGDRVRESTLNPNTLLGRRGSSARNAGGGKTVEDFCAESEALSAFISDPSTVAKRIAYDDLTFLRLLSKGAFGEVWLGQLETRHVAIKKLLPERQHATPHLEQFAAEIQLMAALEHTNIVAFVGVSWNKLQNLSAVVEYMDAGDLDAVLRKLGPQLIWRREKIKVAMGIAEGLVYLHCLRPVVVHRDLKSKNVLLTRSWHAKLSDFGVSRQTHINETMTSGVGTLLWTAPEIIQGRKYSEKADVYSLGVVLSELDTCLPPFAHVTGTAAAGNAGERLPGMQIAQLVKLGKARVGFRDDCPPALRELALECTHLDPDRRPSAMQVAFTLKSIIAPALKKTSEGGGDTQRRTNAGVIAV